MEEAAQGTPWLSRHRAFVVQFGAETAVERGCATGRVEHVASGQTTHFYSLHELLAFIARVLASLRIDSAKKI